MAKCKDSRRCGKLVSDIIKIIDERERSDTRCAAMTWSDSEV